LLPEAVAASLARQGDDAGLLLVAHGALERLALERLPLDGRPLEERFVLSFLPGLVSARPRPAGSIGRWNFVGAPGASNPLPSARLELESLAAKSAGAGSAIGDDFTRAALLAAITGGGGLHVATHTRKSLAPKPGRFDDIGFEVAGGDVVSAEEIRRNARALELVVLSSCASAEGRFLDAEGLQGVARAFLEAGARDVIATLRPVGDRAAGVFAHALHRRLEAGDSRAFAVRAARQELRAAGFASADWTAFRLLGQD
jgi:CHAT domain-containing protein